MANAKKLQTHAKQIMMPRKGSEVMSRICDKLRSSRDHETVTCFLHEGFEHSDFSAELSVFLTLPPWPQTSSTCPGRRNKLPL
eukprot:757836-Hanusia_phi.AAC.3